MNERQQEHYEIGLFFGIGREFSRAEFKNIYRQKYPNRKPGSMIPSDYCINLHPKGNGKLSEVLTVARSQPLYVYRWSEAGMMIDLAISDPPMTRALGCGRR